MLAWCWVFATFLSRETLYVIMKEETQKNNLLTEYEKEFLTELEIEKLTPILKTLKGVSYVQAESILIKALEKLKRDKGNSIF